MLKRMKIKCALISCFLLLSSSIALASETVRVYRSKTYLEHAAFVIFYMSSCPHCRRFDPILKQYALSHRIPVLAYALHGEVLPSFPDSRTPTPDELKQFFPNGHITVPALFLMDLKTKKLYPVLSGEATAEQLDRRLKAMKEAINA